MRILEAVTENAHGHWRKGSQSKRAVQKGLVGIGDDQDSDPRRTCCRCMLSLHGWWTRMPPHHPASNQTPRESRACQLGQLASSPAKNRQAQEHGASSRAWRREGGCPEKCTPCPVCRWVTGALTVDGILGSILPRSSPASEHLFFQ